MKVYTVTVGEYSSSYVKAIFSTREKAKNYIDFLDRTGCPDYGTIDEYELDSESMHITLRVPWMVVMYDTGEVEEAYPMYDNYNNTPYVEFQDGKYEFEHWSYIDYNNVEREGYVIRNMIMAIDEEHAIKITSELRRKLLYHGGWGDPKKIYKDPNRKKKKEHFLPAGVENKTAPFYFGDPTKWEQEKKND